LPRHNGSSTRDKKLLADQKKDVHGYCTAKKLNDTNSVAKLWVRR